MMKRRRFITGTLGLAALAGGGYTAWRYWPDDGFLNPCLDPIPQSLLEHELVQQAWQGIDAEQFWDCHVHLVGVGDQEDGLWIHPDLQSWAHPILKTQTEFYLNAACTDDKAVDHSYLARLLALHRQAMGKSKLMLLAFDMYHNEAGERVADESHFYTANEYTAWLANRHGAQLEWIASIHPYRQEAVDSLHLAVRNGARAIKWLPSAMGIDPSSPKCDPFYEALARFNIPLLTHGGMELAVSGAGHQHSGNPLLLRRALEHGVRVIVAHCASLGQCRDLDKGPNGPQVPCFDLFARMMDEPQYEKILFGDLSGLPQINRVGRPLEVILQRQDWHPRLLNGSDYPLPGVMPLFSPRRMVGQGYLHKDQLDVLMQLRRYNGLLFDFVLKRSLRYQGHEFLPDVFHTKRFFQ